MGSVEGTDDNVDGPAGAPLPADDRLWRHPAERGAEQAAANLAARRAVGRRWPAMVMSFVAGASLVGLAWIFDDNQPPIIEETTIQEITPTTATLPVDGPLRFDDWAGEIAQMNINSVIGLRMGEGAARANANAILYADDGHLITSAHAIGSAEDITATLPSGATIPAQVVAADAVSGVAVLKINSPELPPPSFGKDLAVLPGDRLVAIGGRGMDPDDAIRTVDLVAKDAVTKVVGGDLVSGLMRLSGDIDGSWAGAPIVDEHGGIIAMTVEAADGSPFAIPTGTAREIAADLIDTGETDHKAWLGIDTRVMSDSLLEDRQLRGGVLVFRVWERTPAAQAGVQAGDVIVGAGSVNILARDDLGLVLRAARPGDEIDLRIARQQPSAQVALDSTTEEKIEVETIVVRVTLGATPDR